MKGPSSQTCFRGQLSHPRLGTSRKAAKAWHPACPRLALGLGRSRRLRRSQRLEKRDELHLFAGVQPAEALAGLQALAAVQADGVFKSVRPAIVEIRGRIG